MIEPTLDYLYLPLLTSHQPFIYSAWIKSSTSSGKINNQYVFNPLSITPNQMSKSGLAPIIEQCLTDYTTIIFALDEEELIGFINFYTKAGVPVINFLYIKNLWRQRGLARKILGELFPGVDTLITTTFTKYLPLMKDKLTQQNIIYNPFMGSNKASEGSNGN